MRTKSIMKVNLWDNGSWKLFEGTLEKLQKEFNKRKIIIFDSVRISDKVRIGYRTSIGYGVSIGDGVRIFDGVRIGYGVRISDKVRIGDRVRISDGVSIGDSVRISDGVHIGYGVRISDKVRIGDRVRISDEVSIGDGVRIFDGVRIGDRVNVPSAMTIKKNKNPFSELNIFLMTGIIVQNRTGLFYKAVRPDLTDFWSGEYMYEIGKGDKKNLKRDQNIECGEGWHFTSYSKAIEFLNRREGKIISAKVRIEDILSVHEKIRTKAFSNVQLVQGAPGTKEDSYWGGCKFKEEL